MRRASQQSEAIMTRTWTNLSLSQVFMPLFLVLGLALPPGASAQHTSRTLPVLIETDIPSMLLSVDDFGIDGMMGNTGFVMGAEGYAEFLAPSNTGDVSDLAGELDGAGLHGGAVMLYALVSPTDAGLNDISAGSLVAEYEDVDGAETGFDLAVATARGADTEDVDIPQVGDKSALIRKEQHTLNPPRELVQLDLIIQVDRYVGAVGIAWFDDARSREFDADEMVALAEELHGRIEAGAEGDYSGTALTVLRMDGIDGGTVDWYQEQFDIRDGDYVTMASDEPGYMEPVVEFWEESRIDEIYRVTTTFVLPEGEYATYTARAYDLGRSRTADRWVDDAAAFFRDEDPPGGYTDFGEAQLLSGFDVDVVAVTYAWEQEATGMRIWFPVDGVVYSLEADGPNGIDEDVFFELIDMQIECAENDGYCEPIPVPEDLYR